MTPSLRSVRTASAVFAVFVVGCGTSTADQLGTAASALVSSQCTLASAREAAQVCFDAFDACKAADGAVVDDCKTTLRECLPRPTRGPGGPGGHGGPGGPGERNGGACGHADGGAPGRGGDGAPPPRGEGPGRGGGRPGPGGRGGPDDAAITACHDALDACLSDPGTQAATCFDTEQACVRAAFDADFQARCADAASTCAADPNAPADLCTHIQERCAAGVGAPPVGVDGGVACE